MGALSNIGSSITGNIEKARITLHDYRFDAVDGGIQIKEYQQGRAYVKVTGLDGVSKTNYFDVGSKNLQAIGDYNLMLSGAFSAPRRTFIVKFNPSTLSLQGYGGGRHHIANYTETSDDKEGLSFGALKPRVQFGAQLIFDTTHNYEALKTVVSAFKGEKETIQNSVRKQVEGFVAALQNPRTRVVTFSWGKMELRGVMNSLDINYTMFASNGNPVRATVQFQMVLVDQSVYEGSGGIWEKKVNETFEQSLIADAKQKVTDNVSKSQYVESLFNISL